MQQEFLGQDARKIPGEGLLDDGIDAELKQHMCLGRGRHDQARGIFRVEERTRVRKKSEDGGNSTAAARGLHRGLDDGAVAEVHAVEHPDGQMQWPRGQRSGLFERGKRGIHTSKSQTPMSKRQRKLNIKPFNLRPILIAGAPAL